MFVAATDLNPYKARVLLLLLLAADPPLARDPQRLQALFAAH
jgi:L-asparaginase